MVYLNRLIETSLNVTLARGKSVLLLGARQTGKTTLINQLNSDWMLSLIQPVVRQRYERNPSLLTGEIEALAESVPHQPLVIIDEVQKVPLLMDVIQDLIDRKIAQFILTGSSARKLRSGSKINLLPGRINTFHLDPLLFEESISLRPKLIDLLLYGSLPGFIKSDYKEQDLTDYVTTYLEEEIRAEASVRNIGNFSRFLRLAAAQSGDIINFTKLSQEIGVAHSTIADYYQILEDCLIVERIEPLLKTQVRRRLLKSPRYLFFDLGVRRLSAEEGDRLPETYLGHLFEQWVGLELIYRARLSLNYKIYFWRDVNGIEVDWILQKNQRYIPIEVKWTDKPQLKHIKHLQIFKTDYPETECAYVICQTPHRVKLAEDIYALPWQEIASIF